MSTRRDLQTYWKKLVRICVLFCRSLTILWHIVLICIYSHGTFRLLFHVPDRTHIYLNVNISSNHFFLLQTNTHFLGLYPILTHIEYRRIKKSKYELPYSIHTLSMRRNSQSLFIFVVIAASLVTATTLCTIIICVSLNIP